MLWNPYDCILLNWDVLPKATVKKIRSVMLDSGNFVVHIKSDSLWGFKCNTSMQPFKNTFRGYDMYEPSCSSISRILLLKWLNVHTFINNFLYFPVWKVWHLLPPKKDKYANSCNDLAMIRSQSLLISWNDH